MVTCMKTTIDIPDALAREAKALAQRQGASLRELVIAGLHAEVARRSESRPAFTLTTVPGGGLHPDVRPEDLTALAYDLAP